MCIDIVEIANGIANGQISWILSKFLARNMSIFSFTDSNFSKYEKIFTKLGMCIDIVILFGIANGQILSVFDRVISPYHIRILVPGQSE